MLKGKLGILIIGCMLTFVVITIGVIVWKHPNSSETADVAHQTPTDVEQSMRQKPTHSGKVLTKYTQTTPARKRRVKSKSPNTTDVDALEQELSTLSLKDIVGRLESIDTEMLRNFFEMDTDWFRKRVEEDAKYLTDDEQIALETAFLRAFPEEKETYEKEHGRPHPPPGYSYVRIDGDTPKLVKNNTPFVHIKNDGLETYGNYEKLSDEEWQDYKLLTTIANNDPELWKLWDVQILRDVVERAKEMKQSLHKKTWGARPIANVHAYYTRKKTADDEVAEAKMLAEAQVEIESKKRHRSRGFHRDDVLALIKQIKEDLNRR